eukprot:TRINITY_DN6856_c0_g1_i1.p1 TRINITY_DN6856_c0_g1~~TRINITY_DN6856_c0_g1_i1.p1  ORF type:complete len:203 (-),score=40.53 TRINITY_DN6856_c0_g1_i1:458-1066(-)
MEAILSMAAEGMAWHQPAAIAATCAVLSVAACLYAVPAGHGARPMRTLLCRRCHSEEQLLSSSHGGTSPDADSDDSYSGSFTSETDGGADASEPARCDLRSTSVGDAAWEADFNNSSVHTRQSKMELKLETPAASASSDAALPARSLFYWPGVFTPRCAAPASPNGRAPRGGVTLALPADYQTARERRRARRCHKCSGKLCL